MAATTSTGAPTRKTILRVIEEAGEPLPPKEIARRGELSDASVRSTVRDMKQAGLLSQPGYGLYDLPKGGEEDENCNRLENNSADGDTEAPTKSGGTTPTSLIAFPYYPEGVGAGPGRENSGRETMYIDRRLSRDLPPAEKGFVTRAEGASMEPYIRNGDTVVCENANRVTVPDIYVFFFGRDDGEIIKYLERTPDGLMMMEYGIDPHRTEFEHLEDHTYRDPQGRTVDIIVHGRVLGVLGRPSFAMALQRTITNEMRRMLGN